MYVSAIQLKMCDIYFKIWHDIYIFIYLKPAENRRPYVSYFFNAFSYGCHSFIKNCFYTSNLFNEKNEHYYLFSRNYIFSVGAAIFSINLEIFALCWKNFSIVCYQRILIQKPPSILQIEAPKVSFTLCEVNPLYFSPSRVRMMKT